LCGDFTKFLLELLFSEHEMFLNKLQSR